MAQRRCDLPSHPHPHPRLPVRERQSQAMDLCLLMPSLGVQLRATHTVFWE